MKWVFIWGANYGDRLWEMVLVLLWDESIEFSFTHRSFSSLHSQAVALGPPTGMPPQQKRLLLRLQGSGTLLTAPVHVRVSPRWRNPEKWAAGWPSRTQPHLGWISWAANVSGDTQPCPNACWWHVSVIPCLAVSDHGAFVRLFACVKGLSSL